MRKSLLLLALAVLIFSALPASAQPISRGGISTIACVGTPGNTIGVRYQQCQTAAGVVYACNQTLCSLTAHWVSVTGSGSFTYPSAGVTVSTGVAWGSPLTADTGATNDTLAKRDSSGGLAATVFTATPSGGKSGYASWPQGTVNTAPANTVGFQAPASVPTAFFYTLPSAPAAGVWHASNANPSVLSVSALDLTADVTGVLPVANGGTGQSSGVVSFTIASGTSALGTSSIASGACATVVTTSATGVASTDAIVWTPNASIKAVTGYAPGTSGGLSIAAYPTANNVNFDVCNWTAGAITPGAVSLNWRVGR